MRPVVLCFSGLDPSGGAGLQADIEAIGAQGAHAVVVCTALTIQDTRRVYGFQAVDPAFLKKQADAVLADLPVAAIKCGMLATPEVAALVREVCEAHPRLPISGGKWPRFKCGLDGKATPGRRKISPG